MDRSASMAGRKLTYARKAARFLISKLTPSDRLAIVTFDGMASVLVPSQPVHDPLLFIHAINSIRDGCGTALFDGWIKGASEVAQHVDGSALNRVLLLSDGEANVGLVDPTSIGAKVAGLTRRGVSTSAFGLGDDFDEDLLGLVASAGDGTLAHIESPRQLIGLYKNELEGLASTFGTNVELSVKSMSGAQLVDVLNDLPESPIGNYQLPNLHYGQIFSMGLSLQLPAWHPNQAIAKVTLAWEHPHQQGPQEITRKLTLPVVSFEELNGFPCDPSVVEQLALLRANRERRRVIADLDRGLFDAGLGRLSLIKKDLRNLPQTVVIREELQLLSVLSKSLKKQPKPSRKRLRFESLRSSLSVWRIPSGSE
jgi:Ca-activated chloride channel family protein